MPISHKLPITPKYTSVEEFDHTIYEGHRNFAPIELRDGGILRSFGMFRHGLIKNAAGDVDEVLYFSRNPHALDVGAHPYANRFPIPIEGQYWQETPEVDKVFVVDVLTAKKRKTNFASQLRWAPQAIEEFESWWMETVFNVGTLKRINEREWDSRFIGYRLVKNNTYEDGTFDLECYPSSDDLEADIPVHDYARRATRPVLSFLLSIGAKKWKKVTMDEAEELVRQDFVLRVRELLRRHHCYTISNETCASTYEVPQAVFNIGGGTYMKAAEKLIMLRKSIDRKGILLWGLDIGLAATEGVLGIGKKLVEDARDAAIQGVTKEIRFVEKEKADALRPTWREDRQMVRRPNRYEKASSEVLQRVFFPDARYNNARFDVGPNPHDKIPVNWAEEYLLGIHWPAGSVAELYKADRQTVLKVEEPTGLIIYYMPSLQKVYAYFDPSREILDEDSVPVTGTLPEEVRTLFTKSPYVVVTNDIDRFQVESISLTEEAWQKDFVEHAAQQPKIGLNLDMLFATDLIGGGRKVGGALPDDTFKQYDNDDAFRAKMRTKVSSGPS